MGQRRRQDDGVAIVEAALALPILFLFVMGLLDLGMWTFNSNQATNAARDGARKAIISFEDADDEGSDDWAAVHAAVQSRVPDRDISDDDISVSCVDPDGDEVFGGCPNAEPSTDRVRVEVRWDWDLMTPVAGVLGGNAGSVTGSATMALVGRPLEVAAGSGTTLVAHTEFTVE